MNRIIIGPALYILIVAFSAGLVNAEPSNPNASWTKQIDHNLLLAKKDKHKHKKHKHKPKVVSYSYYYYPDQHVYFCPVQNVYFYRMGNEWVRSASLPEHLRKKIKHYVIITMNSRKPYLFFKDHKVKYPTKPVIQKYFYYPGVHAYYNPDKKVYFYRINDKWKKAAQLPEKIHTKLGEPVTINIDTDTPYIYFDKHKVKYPKKPVIQKPVIQKYYYYPGVHAYYNPDKKVYFYRINDKWKKAAHLPEKIHVKLGKPVIINLDTDTPYQYFADHKAKYPKKPVMQKPVMQKYYYYPDIHAYYNPAAKKYFFRKNDKWEKAPYLPEDLLVRQGKPVTLNLDTDTPYIYFDEHDKKYGKKKRVYKFFPTLRVYYDPTSKVWFRLEGSTWKKTTEPPADTANKKGFTIQLDTDKPYQFFDIHKQEYGDDKPQQ